MTPFRRQDFTYHGGYLHYGTERKFVARFKYDHAKKRRGRFITFLIKNFTVEEYFAAYDSGIAPLTILTNKGFQV